jgi:hypothetical protein
MNREGREGRKGTACLNHGVRGAHRTGRVLRVLCVFAVQLPFPAFLYPSVISVGPSTQRLDCPGIP